MEQIEIAHKEEKRERLLLFMKDTAAHPSQKFNLSVN